MSESALSILVRELSRDMAVKNPRIKKSQHPRPRAPRSSTKINIGRYLQQMTRTPGAGNPRVRMAAELFVVYIPCETTESVVDSGVETDDADPDVVPVEDEDAANKDGCDDGPDTNETTPLVGGFSVGEPTPVVTVANNSPKGRTQKSIDSRNDKTDTASTRNSDETATSTSPDDRADDVNSNSNAKRSEKSSQQGQDADYFTLEDALQSVLENLGVTMDVWTKTDDRTFWQICFLVEKDECDMMLRRLTGFGIGTIPNTSISLFSTSYHRMTPFESPEETADEISVKDGKTNIKRDVSSEFMKSIKARLTVTEVVERTKASTVLTFDFILLVTLASLIAAMGLVENSSVVLVASMLISPLMGPILGWVFGVVIRNRDLWTLGVTNELIGLGLCIVVGFLFGLVPAAVNVDGAVWGSTDTWPTQEMSSRGLTRSLWVGILIAVPSGAGVALSILGGNAGSLVGVAISASLLPPAVNAGMLWAYSLVTAIHAPATVVGNDTDSVITPQLNATNGTYAIFGESIESAPPAVGECPDLLNNNYQFTYSCSMPREALILGIVSLFLTILNILCIFIMGIAILKLKEVAPHTGANPAAEAFWKKDIKIARQAYTTLKGAERMTLSKLAKEFVQEYKQKEGPPSSNTSYAWTIHGTEAQRMKLSWQNLLESVENSDSYQDVVQRLPEGGRRPFLRQVSRDGSALIKQMSQQSDGSSVYFSPEGSIGFLNDTSPSHHSRTPDPVGKTFFARNVDPSILREKLAEAGSPDVNSKFARFEMPNLKPQQKRPVRGVKRMTSVPNIVIAVPAKAATTTGRFQITSIPEEAECGGMGSRKASAVSIKATNETVKLDEMESDTDFRENLV